MFELQAELQTEWCCRANKLLIVWQVHVVSMSSDTWTLAFVDPPSRRESRGGLTCLQMLPPADAPRGGRAVPMHPFQAREGLSSVVHCGTRGVFQKRSCRDGNECLPRNGHQLTRMTKWRYERKAAPTVKNTEPAIQMPRTAFIQEAGVVAWLYMIVPMKKDQAPRRAPPSTPTAV